MKKYSLTLLLAALLVFTACANGDGGADTPARTDVNLALGEPIGTLDPHFMPLIVESIMRNHIFDTMFLYEDDGTLTPMLALSYDVCADGLVHTFHIRQGVTFHNGAPLTASDVAFSIERARLSPFMATVVAVIDTVEVIDTYTVAVTALNPFALFPAFVGDIAIVNEAHVNAVGDDIIDLPIGTGPYMLYEHNRNVSLTLVANPDYWGGAPSIETVNFRIITDASTALIAFEAGELDRAVIPAANWNDIVAQDSWNTSLNPTLHTTYIIFNHEAEPFTDVRVRQAVNYAINREEMVIFAFEGLATPAYTMTNTDFVFGATDDVRKYRFNPDRAKELLAEAGFPDGLTIPPILTLGGGFFEPVAITLQAHLRAVGIEAEVEVREAAAYVADLMGGNFTIGIMGIMVGYDMDQYRTVFHSERIDNLNMARFSHPRVDELFEIGMVAQTEAERLAAYRELNQIVQEEAVYAPVFFRLDPVAYDRNLNLTHRVIGTYRITEWSWSS